MLRTVSLLAFISVAQATKASENDLKKLCQAMKEEGDDRYDPQLCSTSYIQLFCGIRENQEGAAGDGDSKSLDDVERQNEIFDELFDEYDIVRTANKIDPNADFVIAPTPTQPQEDQSGSPGT